MENESQSIVAQWNELALEAIRMGSALPTATTYQLHIISSAVYDAWAAFDDEAYGHYSEISTNLAATEENKEEAVSFAAYATLTALFPDLAATFSAFMDELGYSTGGAVPGTGSAAGVGLLAANNVFAARQDDGANAENDFADTSGYVPTNSPDPTSERAPGGEDFDPNLWQPLRVPNGTLTDENGVPIFNNDDPTTYVDQVALTPHWGEVDAFALMSGDQFRPDAPPQLGDTSAYVDGNGVVTTGDQAYRDQINEVLQVSADLTTEQKVIAEFWADGPRTESPPGHWNQIAQDIALREGHGIDEDAKMFFALNAAVFDAGIATWEAKYVYDFVRPQSAIRDLYFDQNVEAWGGVNQGTQEILGQEWQPYQNVTFVTPPFPEFVSGHSTFSMAAANTIAAFVGSDQFYDGTTLGNYDLDGVEGTDLLGQYVTSELVFEDFGEGPPVVLQWETLTEAALEAGASRIYGGIHIQDGNLRGLEVGEAVADNAEVRWEALFSRGGDDNIQTDAAGGLTIAGAGDDTVAGLDGDDIVEAGSGNDRIDGGAGFDILVLDGDFKDYAVAIEADQLTLTDNGPSGSGIDVLSNVEGLRFDDLAEFANFELVDVATLQGATRLSAQEFLSLVELYVATFDRAPDALGLMYWANALADGMPIETVAQYFYFADPTLGSTFPGQTAGDIVNDAYNLVLERDADAAGLEFWANALEAGSVIREELILDLLEGARTNTAASLDNLTIEQKTEIGISYAIENGLSSVENAAMVMETYDRDRATQSLADALDLVQSFAEASAGVETTLQVVGLIDDPVFA